MVEASVIIFAFSLTLFAGLSTGIGSALAFFTKHTNTKFLAIALGFSAGVMIYVSLVEIFIKGKIALVESMGVVSGNWIAVGAFFGGVAIAASLDKILPSVENPHDYKKVEDVEKGSDELRKNRKLIRMGTFAALALAIHNFPEGLATFAGALSDPALGIAIAAAIAIHNIPEGIAVSVPIFYATVNRRKAFGYSFLSGIAEPIGAAVGFGLLWAFFSDMVFGVLFAVVAGIMIFISLDQLLPAAREYGEHHLSIYGLFAGMLVMAVSLLLFL
jgi:ZIP family zinc transporter